ncbi:MAG: CBS domain-containing protein [Nitrosopumilus sp.]|nr:CBS domain-containing protein [Nitrosopumilus sp.]MDH3824678.1 CBS domain-containing protein [Nitrosopumilus sp.]
MVKQYSTPVITISPDSSVFDALQEMKNKFVKRLVITNGAIPLGIITERDINKFLEDDKTVRAVDEIPIKHLMQKNIVLITDGLEDDFYQCAAKMENLKIGSVILVDKNRCLSGIISRTDIVKSYANVFGGKYRVKDFMSTRIVTCRKSDSLKFALNLMNQNKVSRLVVTDKNGSAVGLITTNTLLSHSDYFTRGNTRSRDYLLPLNGELNVSDLLEGNLITINEEEDLARAAGLMIKNKISGIPVLNSNQDLIGLVSKTDVVKAFSDVAPHENLKLRYSEMY